MFDHSEKTYIGNFSSVKILLKSALVLFCHLNQVFLTTNTVSYFKNLEILLKWVLLKDGKQNFDL